MKRLPALLFVSLILLGRAAPAEKPSGSRAASASGDRAQTELAGGLYAEFRTPRGVILCELFPTRTPLTVASFVGLAEGTLGPSPPTSPTTMTGASGSATR